MAVIDSNIGDRLRGTYDRMAAEQPKGVLKTPEHSQEAAVEVKTHVCEFEPFTPTQAQPRLVDGVMMGTALHNEDKTEFCAGCGATR